MENLLKRHKIKITPQRRELIRILEELGNTHPSFNGIYQAIKSTHPNVSRSTVYENLKLLVELGVIQSFHYKGEIRYEMDLEPHVNLAEPDGIITDINRHSAYLIEVSHVKGNQDRFTCARGEISEGCCGVL